MIDVTAARQLDFGSPDTYLRDDIHAVWRTLRREAPVFFSAASSPYPIWVVTDHESVSAVLSRQSGYTSERGMVLGVPAEGDPAGGRMLVATDPPRHAALRRLFGQGLSRSIVDRVRDRVGERVRSLLTEVDGRCIDFVERVAGPIPVCAICALLGVPTTDEAFLYDRSRIAFASEDPVISGDRAAAIARAEAHSDLLLYFADHIAFKRAHPADDLLTALAHAEVDGEALALEDILLNCDNVLLGGNETTRYALTGAVLSIVEQPEAWTALYASRDVSRRTVDELLRWTSPGQHVMRVAQDGARLGEHRIAAGDRVTCWIPAANRDERVFDRADELILDREVNPHLTFGAGNHHCWGAAFARMEMALFLAALVQRRLRPVLESPPVRVRSTLMHGIRSVRLTLRPDA